MLNHSGLFFFANARVEPNPANIPAVATVVRKAPPVKPRSRLSNVNYRQNRLTLVVNKQGNSGTILNLIYITLHISY